MSRNVDTGRRRLLVRAVTAVGLVGAASAAYPFIRSWEPSERAKALGAPIDIDIASLEPGAMVTVLWRGKPVYVVRRPPELLATLAGIAGELVDPLSLKSDQPDYAKNLTRSRTPEFLVVLGVCTHLQCAPSGDFSGPSPRPDIVPVWPGGFFCACHGSVYDAAGRVFKDVPAPANLPIPPYYFQTPTRIVVGLSDAPAVA
jgi:ubiquinol-cytochrome c reductase iron-sulfur subunit